MRVTTSLPWCPLILALVAAACSFEAHFGEVGIYPRPMAAEEPRAEPNGEQANSPVSPVRGSNPAPMPPPATPDRAASGEAVRGGPADAQVAVLRAPVLDSAGWPSMNYDAENTRFNRLERTLSVANVVSLKARWTTAFSDSPVRRPNAISGTPAVFDGRVYTCDQATGFSALDAQTGQLLWRTTETAATACSSPLVVGDAVYFARGANLHGLDRIGGAPIWRTMIAADGGQIGSSPMLAAGNIVIGSAVADSATVRGPVQLGAVVAVDAADGHEVWRLPLQSDGGSSVTVESSAAYDGTGLIFIGTRTRSRARTRPIDGTLGDALLAIDAASGELRWSHVFRPSDGLVAPSCGIGVATSCPEWGVVASPNLFVANGIDAVGVGTLSGTYTAFDRMNGSQIWSADLNSAGDAGRVTAVAAVGDGRIYVSRNDRRDESSVWALQADTGSAIWMTPMRAASHGGLTLANGVLYLATARDGIAHAIDAATGSELWSLDLGHDAIAGFAVVDAMLFAPSGDAGMPAAARPGASLTAFGL